MISFMHIRAFIGIHWSQSHSTTGKLPFPGLLRSYLQRQWCVIVVIVCFCFFRVSCKASLLSFLDRSLCHTITRFSDADLSHSPKKNDNGKIHKENIQPHTLISTTPRVVPFATQNHSKKMRLKWHLQLSEHTVFIRKWLMHRIVRLPLVVAATQPITIN